MDDGFSGDKRDRQELLEQLPIHLAAITKLDVALDEKKAAHKKAVATHQGKIDEIMDLLSDSDGKQLKLRPAAAAEGA